MSRTPRTDGPAGPDHPYVPELPQSPPVLPGATAPASETSAAEGTPRSPQEASAAAQTELHSAEASALAASSSPQGSSAALTTTAAGQKSALKVKGTELAVVGNDALPPQERAEGIRAMFGRIAGGYDLMNHAMSGGLDFYWRRVMAQRVAERAPTTVLDLATGSGDSALALTKHKSYTKLCVGADFCLPMLRVAQKKGVAPLCVADGLRLPFRSASFDVVTISFGWRNIVDRTAGYRELRRVLRPGGQLFILELSTPWQRIAPAYFWWLRNVMPLYSSLLTKEKDAYQYLAASIQAFPKAPELAKEMEQGGFRDVKHWQLNTGIVALHRGSV